MMKKGEWTVALFISLTTDAVTGAIAGVIGGRRGIIGCGSDHTI